MRRLWMALSLAALVPPLALAQGGPPPGGGPARRMYDPSTVVTVSGTVTGEARVDRGRGHKGVHLTLRTADGDVSVHLGPDSWVDRQKVKIATGDAITVKGSRITFEGAPAIIAESVAKGGETLVLRSPDGVPVWPRPAQK